MLSSDAIIQRYHLPCLAFIPLPLHHHYSYTTITLYHHYLYTNFTLYTTITLLQVLRPSNVVTQLQKERQLLTDEDIGAYTVLYMLLCILYLWHILWWLTCILTYLPYTNWHTTGTDRLVQERLQHMGLRGRREQEAAALLCVPVRWGECYVYIMLNVYCILCMCVMYAAALLHFPVRWGECYMYIILHMCVLPYMCRCVYCHITSY